MPRRSPAPDERQRDAERSRQQILDAGTEEFAAHGYAGARVDRIASRAGVNKQLISYYFGGKEGLYRAIGQRWREREAAEILPDTDPVSMLRRYVRVALQDPAAAKLLAWEGLGYRGPDHDVGGAERDERLVANLEVFSRAQRDGELDPRFDPRCIGLILIAAANAPSVYPQLVRGLCQADATSAEFIEHFADQLAMVAELLLSRCPREGTSPSP